ncbi:hypothetical protein [Kitasatospora sp. NPDC096204]|uniref:DUF7919 family protein n=1 Tax=Kitasatospora sp. NPDC096204 TaxID=3364094 RepID=UPI0038096C66
MTKGYGWVNFQPDYRRVNVGWLAAGHPYTEEPPSEDLVQKLAQLRRLQGVNETMSPFHCEFCPPCDTVEANPGPLPGNREHSDGFGEIRVPGSPGTVFAAPTLISHYVADHHYRPPQEFIDAVLAFDPVQDTSPLHPWAHFPWIPDDAEYEE